MRVREWCDQVSSLLCICMCVGFPFNYFIIITSKENYSNLHCSLVSYYCQGGAGKREKMEMRERENKKAWIRDQGRCHRGSSNARLLCMHVRMHVYVPLDAGMRLWACIHGNFAFSENTIHVIGRCQSGGVRCDVGDQFYRPSSHERV